MSMQTLDNATSVKLAGENPDYGIQKLFGAIENKQYPSWTVYVVSIPSNTFLRARDSVD
jgi:catalase